MNLTFIKTNITILIINYYEKLIILEFYLKFGPAL